MTTEDERRSPSAELVRSLREGGRADHRALAELFVAGNEGQDSNIPLPNLEVAGSIERFSPEQVAGLKAVGFDFVVPTYAKSIGGLISEGHIIAIYLDEEDKLRGIVPPASEVAVRSRLLKIPGSGGPLDEQRQMIAGLEKSLRQQALPKNATLDGITFGLDHAATHAQIDISFTSLSRRHLYRGVFARTEDITSGSRVAEIGRGFMDHELEIFDRGHSEVRGAWVVPVARPVAKQ